VAASCAIPGFFHPVRVGPRRYIDGGVCSASNLDLLAGRASSLSPYEAALDAKLALLHRSSWKLKAAIDRWPRASWRFVRTGLFWRSIDALLQGELAHPGEQHGLARVPLRALAILGRS